jgi:DNA-binding HxlR family transcriptional regulator
MKKRTYYCGLEAALDVVGGKWKPLVLWHLASGTRRFGELRRLVEGISEKMLIQQLREMEADGIVARKVFHEVPPRVQYSLTEFGVSLGEALRPLCEWGGEHMSRIQAGVGQVRSPHRRKALLQDDAAESI